MTIASEQGGRGVGGIKGGRGGHKTWKRGHEEGGGRGAQSAASNYMH